MENGRFKCGDIEVEEIWIYYKNKLVNIIGCSYPNGVRKGDVVDIDGDAKVAHIKLWTGEEDILLDVYL
jgi:hypothetical protein